MASRATEGSLFTGDERARIKRIGKRWNVIGNVRKV